MLAKLLASIPAACRFVPFLLGIVLLVAAAAATVGGFSLDLGLVELSARNPARLAMEGCIALFIAAILRWNACDRRLAVAITLLLAVHYVALIAESTPRRVGDGYEYIAMARQLSAGRPPSLTPPEAQALAEEFRSIPGYAAVPGSMLELVAADGRQEFIHFWTYSLVVAPVLAAVAWAGGHWNHAFAAVNVGLLLTLAYVLLRRTQPSIALAIVAGPVIWWIDKAHVEVFTFAVLGMCVVLLAEAPAISIFLAGVLASQNPAFVLVLAAVAAPAIWQATDRMRILAAAAGASLVAASNPLYYIWRLGRPFPLGQAAVWEWPSFTAVVTPFCDPLAGIFWYYPWALLLVPILFAGGASTEVRGRGARASLLVAAVSLAFIVALSGNINHGATPGPSRYGVWLLAIALAWVPGLTIPQGWCRGAVKFVAVVSIVHVAWAFHPKIRRDTWYVPPVAAQLVERAPSLYNPLPEVFAERFGRVDGPARLPVASPSCSKVLLVGRGRPHMSWPIPCVPREPPPDCLVAGHLCYANRQADGSFVFAVPPRQPGFAIADDSADLVWSDVSEFAGLPVPFPWGELRETPPLSDHSIFRDAEHVRRIRAFQADTATIAFVEPLDEHAPRVRIRPGAPTRLWWIRRAGLTVVATGEVTVESWVHAPTSEPLILVVALAAE